MQGQPGVPSTAIPPPPAFRKEENMDDEHVREENVPQTNEEAQEKLEQTFPGTTEIDPNAPGVQAQEMHADVIPPSGVPQDQTSDSPQPDPSELAADGDDVVEGVLPEGPGTE